MKPGDLVKLNSRLKSNWKLSPPVVCSQFGILIEAVEVEKHHSPWAFDQSVELEPGWIVSTTDDGLVRKATRLIHAVVHSSDVLRDLITARDLFDKKIKEIQEGNQ